MVPSHILRKYRVATKSGNIVKYMFFKGVYYYWISTHGKTVSPDFTIGYLVASTPLVIKPNDVCRSNDQIRSQSTSLSPVKILKGLRPML